MGCDEEDAARVIAGDRSAFEGIVRRWQGPVLNLAWRSARHRETAEDLAQEIFLQVFRALPSRRGDSRFSTWMFAVALNHLRSRARRPAPPHEGLEAAFELPDPASVRQDAGGGARAEELRRAVRGLPARYRDAVLAHYFEGRDVRGASERLCVGVGTLKARLSRARAQLKTMLATRKEA